MRLSLLISLSLLLLSWQPARAQLAPADDFFNSGAQFYISNNIPAALAKVELGREMYPDDVKLKKLEELLKQQQQQQQNQQNQSQQQHQKDQKSGQQKSQADQKNSQDQQKQEAQKPKPADQKKEEPQKQPEPQKNSPEKQNAEKQNGQAQPVQPGQMTPEEAKRLLDAQKENERLLRFKPEGKPRDSQRPVKDW